MGLKIILGNYSFKKYSVRTCPLRRVSAWMEEWGCSWKITELWIFSSKFPSCFKKCMLPSFWGTLQNTRDVFSLITSYSTVFTCWYFLCLKIPVIYDDKFTPDSDCLPEIPEKIWSSFSSLDPLVVPNMSKFSLFVVEISLPAESWWNLSNFKVPWLPDMTTQNGILGFSRCYFFFSGVVSTPLAPSVNCLGFCPLWHSLYSILSHQNFPVI